MQELDSRWIDRESRQRFDLPTDRSFLCRLDEAMHAQLQAARQLDQELEYASEREKDRNVPAVCHAEPLAVERLREAIEGGRAYIASFVPELERARREAAEVERRVRSRLSRSPALAATFRALGQAPPLPRGLEAERRGAAARLRLAEARLSVARSMACEDQARSLRALEAYHAVRNGDLREEVAILREEEAERKRKEEEEEEETARRGGEADDGWRSPSQRRGGAGGGARAPAHSARVRRLLKRKYGVTDDELSVGGAPIDVSERVDAAEATLRIPAELAQAPRTLCALPLASSGPRVQLASLDDFDPRSELPASGDGAGADYQAVLTVSMRGALARWALGRREHTLLADLRRPVECACPFDEGHVAIGDKSGHIHVLDTAHGQPYPGLTTSWQVSRAALLALRAHPTRRGVLAAATSSGDCAARIVDVLRRRQLCSLRGHRGRVADLDWVAIGKWRQAHLATAGVDGTVRLWRPEDDGGPLHSGSAECVAVLLGHAGPVRCVRHTPIPGAPSMVCSGGDDGTVLAWDLRDAGASGLPAVTLAAHTGYVMDVTGLRGPGVEACVASGSFDRTVRVWDLRSGDCVATLNEHKGFLHQVCALDPEGGPRIATTANDGTIKVWDLRMAVEAAKRRMELETMFTKMAL